MNTREKYAEMLESEEYAKKIAIESREPYKHGLENMSVIYEEVKPTDKATQRKATPVFSGVVEYFPNAIKEIAKCSYKGNEQHHPNTPLHWDKNKSKDNADALMRHLIDHIEDPVDADGQLHLAKVAWRALALLEVYLESK